MTEFADAISELEEIQKHEDSAAYLTIISDKVSLIEISKYVDEVKDRVTFTETYQLYLYFYPADGELEKAFIVLRYI